MAKEKPYEEMLEKQTSLKTAINENKAALKAYYQDNKLKKNQELEGKHAKAVDKLERAIERDREALEKLNIKVKEGKPRKERVAKYEYPEGLTNEEKKKWRAKVRAGNKPKAEKAPKKEKAEKSEKVSKKDKSGKKSKEERTGKVSKKDKSGKKSKRSSED